jgi:hypothetical protein
VLEKLGLARKEELEEAVDPGLYAVGLDDGWFLVIGSGWDFMDALKEDQAVSLSESTETYFFYTDDTPMGTRLAAYSGKEMRWAITYDGTDGISDPVIEGDPPDVVAKELSKATALQAAEGGKSADVDFMYETTAMVARELLGFRHDETIYDEEKGPFFLLAQAGG